jgi:hypothetical protein
MREDDQVSAVAPVVDAGAGAGTETTDEAALEAELQAEITPGGDGAAPDGEAPVALDPEAPREDGGGEGEE